MICFVTGLAAEARIARALGPSLAGGGTAAGAAHAAEKLIDSGATALVSFGLAGGLNVNLPPGTLVVPACLVTENRRFLTDAALTGQLGGPAYTLYASPAMAVTAAEKRRLYETTGADAIDMESGAVAGAAAARRVPFAALRVVCDPASSTLPPAAQIALNGQGRIVVLKVAGSVLRQPAQMADLVRLGRDAARARRVLVGCVSHLKKTYPFEARALRGDAH